MFLRKCDLYCMFPNSISRSSKSYDKNPFSNKKFSSSWDSYCLTLQFKKFGFVIIIFKKLQKKYHFTVWANFLKIRPMNHYENHLFCVLWNLVKIRGPFITFRWIILKFQVFCWDKCTFSESLGFKSVRNFSKKKSSLAWRPSCLF